MSCIKAIITDLDQTLLRTDKTLSEESIRALRKAKDNGLLVMAATARPARTIQKYLRMAGFDAVTTLNGARTFAGDRVIERYISRETGEQILRSLTNHEEALVSIETSDGIYANRYIPEWKTADWPEYPALPENISLYKILVSEVEEQVLSEAICGDTYYTRAQNRLFQIMSGHIRKWNGIQDLMQAFGLSPDEVMYFGDDYDDVEPVKLCGIGIAVSNAVPPVLEAADQVIGSNDDDAVAQFLNTWMERR